jgi:hypothetical protein
MEKQNYFSLLSSVLFCLDTKKYQKKSRLFSFLNVEKQFKKLNGKNSPKTFNFDALFDC